MAQQLKPGDKFMLEGVGYDAEGWLIVNGYRGDGKRGKALKPVEWTASDAGAVERMPVKIEVAAPRTASLRYGPPSRRRW